MSQADYIRRLFFGCLETIRQKNLLSINIYKVFKKYLTYWEAF